MFVLGAGGNGGTGFTGAAASARGGGGGGGSGAQSSWSGDLYMLPNAMAVQVGAGGSGVSTRIAVVPKTATSVITNYLLSLGAGAAGGNGTGAAAGGAGAAGGIASVANNPWSGAGTTQHIVGVAGSAGGVQTGAVGAAVAIPATGIKCMGGSGGGGVTAADFAGGSITAITDSWLSETRPLPGAAGSVAGSGGWFNLNPFWSWPGMGGGSSNAGVGGAGGNAAFGSGGGGGGGGTTGGAGGAGGPGLVIIICT